MDQLSRHEERIRNRRARRWKRRFRILAPLAALPLLLATLVFSVDIIEYAPQEPRVQPKQASSMPTTPPPRQAMMATRAAIATAAVDTNDPFDDKPFELDDFDSEYGLGAQIPPSLPDRMPR